MFPRLRCIIFIASFWFTKISATENEKDYWNNIINEVNSNAEVHWKAGINFGGLSPNHNTLLGSLEDENQLEESVVTGHEYHDQVAKCGDDDVSVFDSREKWKNCPSISKIWNQGHCASDWVIAPVSAITDRLCIYYNGTQNRQLSPQSPLTCCKYCGWGCRKGYAFMVYEYWVKRGLVTGGNYKSEQGCQPYTIKPCKNAKYCALPGARTPKCEETCSNKKFEGTYESNLVKGEQHVRFGCPCCVAGELIARGPITASMRVYEDFLSYKSGIYQHVTGKRLGLLTVKLIGFNETSKPHYWIAANSWGTSWGENGFFKIVKGKNECGIEGSLHAGRVKKPQDDDTI